MREHLTGQFTPGTSILHRLDARAKFFGFLILIAATVCTDAWLGYALLLAVTAAVVAVCGLPLRTALASVARMGWFFLLIFVMNALFFATDDAIWHWWILTLSVPGIVQGAQVTVRLSAFKRADELAMAMEARGYRGARGRTRKKSVPLPLSGWGALALCALVCAAEILL